MRIVSLLPSLTELVHALGRGEDLVGVTHECDHPPGVERLPHLTRSRIPARATSSQIDTLVSEQGSALYELDVELLGLLRPDLVLTQAQCDVCAVSEAIVRRVAERLPGRPRVESVQPTDLTSYLGMIARIGALLDAAGPAGALIGQFEETAAEIARRRAGQPRPRVVFLEWLDPPYCAGHWIPELVAAAGGEEMIGRPGAASRRIEWEEVRAARPEVLLVAPCGFDVARGAVELDAVSQQPGWRDLPAVRAGRVGLVDGSAYFSRPGPRLEASLRIAAALIDPGTCGNIAPRDGWCVRPVLC